MSARFDDESGFFYSAGAASAATLALLEANFDEVSAYQEHVIQRQVDADARYQYLMRRIALLRTVSFPLDYLGTLILLGRAYATKRWNLQKVLWAYLRGRASKTELAEAIQSSL